MRSHSADSISAAAVAQASHAAVLQERLTGGSQALSRSADEAKELTSSGQTFALELLHDASFLTILCHAWPSENFGCHSRLGSGKTCATVVQMLADCAERFHTC